MEAIDTIDMDEGVKVGGLEAGDNEFSLSGDFGIEEEESLNCDKSVGTGGCGIVIIVAVGMRSIKCSQMHIKSSQIVCNQVTDACCTYENIFVNTS